MELQNIFTKIERRYEETSDFLRKTNARECPEAFYKAQGMNEVFMHVISRQHLCTLPNVTDQLAERGVFLASLKETEDIEKQQGAIEALEFIKKLLEETK